MLLSIVGSSCRPGGNCTTNVNLIAQKLNKLWSKLLEPWYNFQFVCRRAVRGNAHSGLICQVHSIQSVRSLICSKVRQANHDSGAR